MDTTLRTVKVRICKACLNGLGEMCNTPGCFLIRHEVLNGWSEYEYAVSKYEYVRNEESDIGETREVEAVAYHPNDEAKIYQALGISRVGTVYVDED